MIRVFLIDFAVAAVGAVGIVSVWLLMVCAVLR